MKMILNPINQLGQTKTPAQRKVLKLMKDKNGYIVPHITMTGRRCYRLRTEDHSPFMNIRKDTIRKLKDKSLIVEVN